MDWYASQGLKISKLAVEFDGKGEYAEALKYYQGAVKNLLGAISLLKSNTFGTHIN